MNAGETYDVVVVGSGAAGAMAALRAASNGLSVLIVEKAHKYGGTSATSGGVMWLPNHQLAPGDDSREQAMQYLEALIDVPVQRDRLEAYVDGAPQMASFLQSLGLPIGAGVWPDYFPELPGARADRSVVCDTFDGRRLGRMFPLMREQYTRFKLFRRYSLDLPEFFAISARGPGWIQAFLKILWRYWTDFGTRRIGARDRRFTQGAALMGYLYDEVFKRGVEVRLETKLEELLVEDGAVRGVTVSNFGRRYDIAATRAVMLAAGGFEWNQALRDRFLPVPGLTRHSSSPEDGNRGEALLAGERIGADTEHTGDAWWIPTMHMPTPRTSNFEEIHQAAFDVGRPHSVCVNRNGDRFVNEACSYDEFGEAMVADQLATGANTPCWLVFDATFRDKFTAGGFMPSIIMPDWRVGVDRWDHYIFKADSLAELAGKINVPAAKLAATVSAMNGFARSGVDEQFGRGGNDYDRMFGDPTVTPNPCLGPIDRPPFYAVPINSGDLGTKGGLKADARGRVLDTQGQVIPGLYAAGNNSGNPFGNRYPGAGGTIGPAMVFAYIAMDDVAAADSGATADEQPAEEPATT